MRRATPVERSSFGRQVRGRVPRTVQGEWEPSSARTDPLEILALQATTRVPDLVPIRYGRMAASAFAFFRGAAAVMAADLAQVEQCREPTNKLGFAVQLCTLRWQGYFLADTCEVPSSLIQMIGSQLGLLPMPIDAYPQNEKTRWEHLERIRQHLAKRDAKAPGANPVSDARWYVNGEGQTMVMLKGPLEFKSGELNLKDSRLSIQLCCST